MPAPSLGDWASHSPYSDPAPHTDLLTAIAPEPAAVHAAACATVVHYRDQGLPGGPTPEQWHDIDRRWLSSTLDAATERAPGPLDAPREPAQQVAGCCRDHTLFSLGVLRSHGVPARSRIGFAGYFEPGFGVDHVVVEHWDGARWVRWDPELAPGDEWDFDPYDMPVGVSRNPESDLDQPFVTAAQAWLAIQAGAADPAKFGVAGVPELSGHGFVRRYVLLEVAHRHRDELLLWDVWGPGIGAVPDDAPEAAGKEAAAAAGLAGLDVSPEEFDALADELAHLLVAADVGDDIAAEELAELYEGDPRLHPGTRVGTYSPSERGGITDLATRTTTWLDLDGAQAIGRSNYRPATS
ncbi:transglutaminase domain-containing protein [Myceligenerans pegani]|uniref:Transglutaminase domain-containing protein n=1 Tax=Myceligenerans pegani TaxID=2776917 RepID=A0ABR9MWF0_9MICO|nr:transglutaminase domain-containing protein [Myceligenerans sp. TRM 65318]MBE1875107.1 transglutaminase domain-containing protein [Myceligenerans sp. TRM 65318]MBE3017378.1 transglutaminase domain-containing protein [Myceligenerans sp. TRM 65318]